MNWPSIILWGFAGTVLLTTLLSASRGLGFTRMDIPFMLGTMFTSDRDRARWIGFIVHLINGWAFALIYAFAFELTRLLHWWFGAIIGLIHALFVLTVTSLVLPSIHPRMASEEHGPDPTRLLEPPGFLALNYGPQTPIATIIVHVVFGALLGLFYRL